MSYEVIRSAYRLWSSDDSTETYLAVGLVLVALAPAVIGWYRGKNQGTAAQTGR